MTARSRLTGRGIWRDYGLEEVSPGAHWAYVVGVLGISFLLMRGLIAWLGASST